MDYAFFVSEVYPEIILDLSFEDLLFDYFLLEQTILESYDQYWNSVARDEIHEAVRESTYLTRLSIASQSDYCGRKFGLVNGSDR